LSRVIAAQSQNVVFDAVSRTLSAPTTSTTSYIPDAMAKVPLRMASLPVAQAFSIRVTGMSVRSSVSAKIPDGNPSVVDSSPNHAAWMSDFVMPLSTFATHSA
jgi:hypothetical protein